MSDPAILELRVFSGPQAGARLPLETGIYRAGSGEHCDILLDDLPDGETAFAIYVGQQNIAVEALSDEVRIGGLSARGLYELRPGEIFAFRAVLMAVDHSQKAWPDDTDHLLAAQETAGGMHAGNDTGNAGDVRGATATTSASDARGTIDDFVGPPRGGAGVAMSNNIEETARWHSSWLFRAMLGHWRERMTAWRAAAGIAVLLVCLAAVATLVTPRSPKISEVRSAGPNPVAALAASYLDTGAIRYETLSDGRTRISGYLSTRGARLELTRRARQLDPSILIQVNTDEDQRALAEDTLSRFANPGIEIDSMHWGRLVMKGNVQNGESRDRIVAALKDEVPGLASIDVQHVTAADDMLNALRVLLVQAHLDAMIHVSQDDRHVLVDGSPDTAALAAWEQVRAKLVARFGLSLNLVENFGVLPRGNMVAAVLGPMPYVLFADGTKQSAAMGGVR